jgi:hypothetical protein
LIPINILGHIFLNAMDKHDQKSFTIKKLKERAKKYYLVSFIT